MSALIVAIRALFVSTVVLGLLYPLLVTGLAQKVLPSQADGTLVSNGETVVGSWLIGQNFTSERYFHGRPSAAGTGYDAASSAASNLGPSNAKWTASLEERAADWQERTRSPAPVPIELLSASGSGLDPHLSPAAARYQIPAVARARNRPPAEIATLVESLREPPQFGLLGEERVNVLALNAALDGLHLQ